MSVAKNTAFMTMASVGQKIVSFVYFTIIARSLGAGSTGKYFFALSFTTIFVVFVDLGLTNVLVRESAKIKERAQAYFSTILSTKIVLAILAYLGCFVTINLLGYPTETRYLVYLSAVTMIFDSLHLSIYGVLRAMGNLKYEAVSIVSSQILSLILGTTFIYLHLPLIWLILAFTIPSALNAFYATLVLYFRFGVRLVPHFDRQIFVYLAKIAVPFSLAAVFARFYSYFDSVLLSKIAGDQALGWYSIPYKITYAFQFFPAALSAALYPKFSECFVNDKARLPKLLERGVIYLLLLSMPIVAGIFVLAKPIILLVFTAEYGNSVLPLQISILAIIFSFTSFPFGAYLNAGDKQKTQTAIVASALVLNTIFNLFLIPRFQAVGASISALASSILMAGAGYYFAPRVAAFSHRFIWNGFFRIAFSAVTMGLAVWFVNLYVNFWLAIVTGVLVYPIMLFITRAVTLKQIGEAREMVLGK